MSVPITGIPNICCCGLDFMRITGRITAFGFLPMDVLVNPVQSNSATIYLTKQISGTGTYTQFVEVLGFPGEVTYPPGKFYTINYSATISIDKYSQDITISEDASVTGDLSVINVYDPTTGTWSLQTISKASVISAFVISLSFLASQGPAQGGSGITVSPTSIAVSDPCSYYSDTFGRINVSGFSGIINVSDEYSSDDMAGDAWDLVNTYNWGQIESLLQKNKAWSMDLYYNVLHTPSASASIFSTEYGNSDFPFWLYSASIFPNVRDADGNLANPWASQNGGSEILIAYNRPLAGVDSFPPVYTITPTIFGSGGQEGNLGGSSTVPNAWVGLGSLYVGGLTGITGYATAIASRLKINKTGNYCLWKYTTTDDTYLAGGAQVGGGTMITSPVSITGALEIDFPAPSKNGTEWLNIASAYWPNPC